MSEPGCLDEQTLASYLELALPADERARVNQHLQSCTLCAQLFSVGDLADGLHPQ